MNIYVLTKGIKLSKYIPIKNLFILGKRGPLADKGPLCNAQPADTQQRAYLQH